MATWRTIRVFVSSTFRDMHAERDHLIKVVFPALREMLLPHRVELYDIDLRWGITEDEAKNEKVISLCLEQVDDCRPFFLAVLGHRYGWVPRQVPNETNQKFPFVSRFPSVSVTELEIRHGIMLNGAPGHTLVLLRNEEAVASIPAATRNRDFVETDPQPQQKLESLKRELESGPYAVQPYSAVWDPKRYDRVNRTEGKLDGLTDFGKQVEDWLWEAIRKELQLPEAPATIDPLDAEADFHERFLELRTRIYVGRDAIYHNLRDFALGHGDAPLLLTGESGLGKSAALACFVRDFRKEHSNVFVLPHFVGASPKTTSLPTMLRRLTEELQQKFKLTLPKAESSDEILRTFIVALTSLPPSARVVLVFDALNQLDADARADTLVWLPEKLPTNVRVVCSSATGPQKVPRVLTAFGERDYIALPLEPLTDDERRHIIRAVPKLVAKALDDRQIDALLANPATHNPLFLMVALEELRGYGSYENLNKVIAKLPREGDALTKLFEMVFARLEKEFGKRLVERVLSLLACARRGLSGPEQAELTGNLGEQAEEVYPLLRQLEPYLHRRDGRYDFYHMSIRRAVQVYYLKWEEEEDQHDPWLRWNPERKPPASEPTEPERETRHRLIDFFEKDRLSPRTVDELPWQLAQLRSWQQLFDLLGDLTFFAVAWRANQLEVRTAWSLLNTVGGLEPMSAYSGVLAEPARHDLHAMWGIAQLLQTSGHGPSIVPLWWLFIDHFRRTNDDSHLYGCLGNLALILKNAGDLEGAMRLHKEEEAICRRLNHLAAFHTCLGNQAVILIAIGNMENAMRLLKETEVICRRLNDQAGLAASLGNQAVILKRTGDLKGAMRLHKEEEAICRRLNDADRLSASLGNQAGILICIGDLTGAFRMYREQEAICRRLNEPTGLGNSLCGQAVILKETGNLDAAMRLLKEHEEICRRVKDQAGLSASLGNQALILKRKGDMDGAVRLLKEEEAICRQLKDLAGLAANLVNQAGILIAIGDLDSAMRLLKEQEAICRRVHDPAGLQASLGNQGAILVRTGDLDEAMQMFKEKEAICHQLHDPNGLASSLANQASLLAFGQSRPVEGLSLAEKALGIATQHGLTGRAREVELIVQQIRKFLADSTR